MKKNAIFAILLLRLFSQAYPSTGGQIPPTILKVKVVTAAIRLEPSSTSAIVARVPEGMLLEATSRSGDWYLVSLPPDEQGKIISGYINSATVENIGQEKTRPAFPPEPVRPKVVEKEPEPAEIPQLRPAGNSKGKLISGFFIKFGGMFFPDPRGFSNAWLASIGADFGLSRNFAIGFEVQPAYRSTSSEEFSFWAIPIMALAQLKAGLDLGGLMPSLAFAHVFVGGGGGVDAAYSVLKHMGDSLRHFEVKPAYRFLAGTEIVLKSLKLIVEYQMTMVSDANVDPDFWGHYFLFGIRF